MLNLIKLTKGIYIMSKNELKNRVRFSTTLEIETDKRLKEFSAKTDIPISKIVNNAVNDYIDKREGEKA